MSVLPPFPSQNTWPSMTCLMRLTVTAGVGLNNRKTVTTGIFSQKQIRVLIIGKV